MKQLELQQKLGGRITNIGQNNMSDEIERSKAMASLASAVDYMEGASNIRTFQGNTPNELWAEFGDVPMNPGTECIEEAWREFPAGTHREGIWHWFEETFHISVHDLMYS